jgi:hypothetical protein
VKALILNSAQSKYPQGNDAWIISTLGALKKLKSNNFKLICSTHPLQWDFTAWAAGKMGMEIELIVNADDDEKGMEEYKNLLSDLALSDLLTTPVFIPRIAKNEKQEWPLRDSVAINSADIIYPVSLRPGGRLEGLISSEPFKNKISADFKCPWKETGSRIVYDFTGKRINNLYGNWLVHWTHSSQGRWPDERIADFFEDMAANPKEYVRSGFHTLKHIIKTDVVRSTSWKMPGNVSMVSFTSLSVEKAVELMRWRKRFVRYSLEPYGIGIRKEVLMDLGAKPVVYEERKEITERKYVQSPGMITKWETEQEWRYEGDLLLNKIHRNDILGIVQDRKGYENLNKTFPDLNIHILFD